MFPSIKLKVNNLSVDFGGVLKVEGDTFYEGISLLSQELISSWRFDLLAGKSTTTDRWSTRLRRGKGGCSFWIKRMEESIKGISRRESLMERATLGTSRE